MIGSRRNPRRNAAQGPKINDSGSEDSEDDPSQTTPSSSPDDEEEEDDISGTPPRSPPGSKNSKDPLKRASSRTNMFRKSMKEPADQISDLLGGTNAVSGRNSEDGPETPRHTPRKAVSSRHPKSPAVRHSSRRRTMRIEVPVDEEDFSSEEEEEGSGESEDEEEEEELLKIQRIVASRSESRRNWRDICKGINTSEIDYGSRWFQEGEESEDDEEDLDAFEERFLVKWSDLSYLHCSWETQEDLVDQAEGGKTYLTTFFRKSENGYLFDADERCDGDYFDPAYVQIDRILDVCHPDDVPEVKSDDPVIAKYGLVMDKKDENFELGTGRQLLVKWGNTAYSDATFEFERDLILRDIDYVEKLKAFETRNKKPSKSDLRSVLNSAEAEKRRSYKIFGDKSNIREEDREATVKAYRKELEENVFKNGGQLRDYQAEGVAWLTANYVNGRSSILADEMGLGKTIQTAAFIHLIASRMKRRGPFLIVAPLSTIPHWYREFTGWTELNTIIYRGSAVDRECIREFEFPFQCDRPKNGVAFNQKYLEKCMAKARSKAERIWMAEVIITTPEMLVTDDYIELTAVDWETIVVDEAHRLKNHNSKLASNLRNKKFSFGHTLLLTGTPIQNDMRELWTLLNFINRDKYEDLETFLERFGDIKSKERIDELHESIRPYILRRLKEDVEKSVPPKEETLIEVELTILQKQYYRALYEKNVQFLHKNKRKALDGPSLSNLAMQLRKCCNHPFLLNGVEEEVRSRDADDLPDGDFLAKASGKLVLLDKLLPRLKENGHKVLLFSQFRIMLDLLEDYLIAREVKSERIDGSITGHKRQMAIDRFQNAPSDGSEAPFIMLLSTRAGGVGINLTAADTCIIFDSDWNPQNDLQAQARCHRIGQTKSVKVYRLLTRKTYEMQMFHLASMKMGLDQAVLQGFESGSSSGEGTMTKEEVERLLRHGAYDIFNEEKAGTAELESNEFVQQDIDSILARRSKTVVHDNTGSGSGAAGGTFSKASFKAQKSPSAALASGETEEIDIDDPEFWSKMVGEEHMKSTAGDDLTGRKRKRNKTNYSELDFDRKIEGVIVMSDSDNDESSSAEYESDTDDASLSPKSTPVPGQTNPDMPSAKRRKKRKEKARWGGNRNDEWGKADMNALVKSLQCFGYGNLPWKSFREKTGLDASKYSINAVRRMCWATLLVIFRETAQEEAQNAKKRAERAADKKRESEGSSSESKATEGGVLGNPQVLEPNRPNLKDDVQLAFAKLLSSNSSWANQVLVDASFDAQNLAPRPRGKLERALHEYAGKQALTSKRGMLSLFGETLWPSLKSRGWTTEQVTEGSYSGTIHYCHNGKEYRSPQAVLHAVPDIHPELKSIVENIKSAETDESEKLAEAAKAVGVLKMSSVSAESLGLFLDMFAPLQLLVDRAQPRSIVLARRTLSICSFLKNAHTAVRNSTTSEGRSSQTIRLAKLLSPDKRMALPHPSWTPLHDAVLVQAITEHGWIEQDRVCHAIMDDPSIRWGVPFDESGLTNKPKVNTGRLRETADRVAEFLNVESDLLEELKALNQNLLVNGYGLRKISDESEWMVDETILSQVPNGDQSSSKEKSDQCQNEMADLPSKKDLLKRAKSVLCRCPDVVKAKAALDAEPTVDYGFVVLDQTDPCNIFLSEMIRTLSKSSFTKSAKARNLGAKLCADAVREAEHRRDAILSQVSTGLDGSAGADMTKIADHLKLVARSMKSSPRTSKNVLRVLLGLPPIASKTNEGLFPPAGTTELELVRTNGPTVSSQSTSAQQKKRRETGAFAEKAISRASAKVITERKTNRKFSAGATSDLELDSTEVLLLSVICSQGIPVWTEHWGDLIAESESADAELQGPGHSHALTWYGLAMVFTSASQLWHQVALKKLEDTCSEYDKKFGQNTEREDSSSQQKALEQIALAEIDERFKCHTLGLAEECATNPLAFAKKVIMLMETLRRRMGSVESKRGASLKKLQSMNKSENGLGPIVLSWLGKELSRWARSFEITDHTGRPHPYTTSTFVHDSPQYTNDNKIGVGGLLDKKACRAVFAQTAQQTRLRSIFVKHNEEGARAAVQKAVKTCRSTGEMWTRQPCWWQTGASNDYQLLVSLIEGGYSGLDEVFATMQPPVDSSVENSESNTPVSSTNLTKAGAQERANQLTRELQGIDDSTDAIRLLEERVRSHGPSSVADRSGEGMDTTASAPTKPAHVPAAQPGIDSFFKRATKQKEATVIVLDEDGMEPTVDDEEAQVLSPGKRSGLVEGAVEEASLAKKLKT